MVAGPRQGPRYSAAKWIWGPEDRQACGWRHDHGQDLSLGQKLGLLVQKAGLAHRQGQA